jgi:hypothetical protein
MEVFVKKSLTNVDSNICILPKIIFERLKLSTDVSYNIHLGLSQKTSLIRFSESDRENIYFPENTFDQLNLLENIKLNLWCKGKHIYLGPVVGIFVNPGFIYKALKSKPHYFATQHMDASLAEGCLSYFFSVNDVDWQNKKVKGVTFIPEINKYEYHWLPLPNVLYDRGVQFNAEEKPLVKDLRRKFRKNSSIKLINRLTTLGKLEVCEALTKYPKTKKYIPDTAIYNDFDDVTRMLDKYELIFIKSYYGTQGKEVLSIEKLSNGYKLNFYENGAKELILNNFNEIQSFVTNFTLNKKFIIQQGIRLLTHKGRNMDLRIFIMKNDRGIWESIFIGTRIAKGHFTITNTCTGGDYAIYEQIYPQLKAEHKSLNIPTAKMLNEVTIMLAQHIEKELGSFGEIGMDIGIDSSGRIWIFEANAKPDKELDPKLLDISGRPWIDLVLKFYEGTSKSDKLQPQALGIFKYAKYLTGTSISNL